MSRRPLSWQQMRGGVRRDETAHRSCLRGLTRLDQRGGRGAPLHLSVEQRRSIVGFERMQSAQMNNDVEGA